MGWAVLWLAGLCLDVSTPEAARQAAQRVFEDSSLQREWPGEPRWETPDGSSGSSDSGGSPALPQLDFDGWRRGGERVSGYRPPLDGGSRPDGWGSSALGEIVLWVVLGLAGVALLVALVRALRTPRDVRAAVPVARRPAAPAPHAPPVPLDDADRLAAEGRHAEAVHALLVALWRSAAASSRHALPDALTSREAAETVALRGAAREDLDTLVATVEVSRWGARPVHAATYATCRGCADRARRALAGGAA